MSAAPKRRLGLRRLAVLLLAVVFGVLVGRSTAPSPPTASAPAPAPSRSGARVDAGVPVSFPKTKTGAAAAVAAYQQAFADPAILRPGILRARVEAVATADYATRMLAVNGPGAERLAAGPIGVGVAHELRTLFAAVPIGYRVLSAAPGRVKIETWGFTLLGNVASAEPAAYFGLSRTEVVWLGDRWRIAKIRSGFGPTPRLGTPPGPLGGYDVIGVAGQLHSYVLAP